MYMYKHIQIYTYLYMRVFACVWVRILIYGYCRWCGRCLFESAYLYIRTYKRSDQKMMCMCTAY